MPCLSVYQRQVLPSLPDNGFITSDKTGENRHENTGNRIPPLPWPVTGHQGTSADRREREKRDCQESLNPVWQSYGRILYS